MLAYISRTTRRVAATTRDKGASAVEYGLMVAAIAALIVGVVFGLGKMVEGAFNKTCQAISSGVAPDGDCGDAPAVVQPPAGGGGNVQ